MSQKGTITTYASGVDLVCEWMIDIFTLTERDGAMDSPDFSFGGEEWYLMIYPDGSSRNFSSGHLDLELRKYPSNRSIKQTFSLSLKTVRGERYNEQHFSKYFDNHKWIYRFNRFIPRSVLRRRRSDLAPDDTLTVIFIMRNSTSPGSDSNTASASGKCCHCKVTFNADSLSSHQNKCMHRPVKCPDCLKVVVLQKWFEEHECQQERPEAGKELKENSENTSVNVSTQTEEKDTGKELKENSENTSVNVSTQTEEKDTGKELKENSENTSVNVSTQTEEKDTGKELKENSENTSVNASTQTEEKDSEDCVSGSSASPYEKKVLHDFKELFLQKEDCDVIIKVKSSEILAHRLVLKVRSPVFASTFRHDMKENATGVVEIEDCDPSPFSDFLCFLYCGDIEMISRENVFSIFRLADKYEILDLKAKCLDFIKKNMTIDTFCETITLALQHSETELIALATDFFVENAEEILLTVKWQIFAAENPTQSNELFIKFVRLVKRSNT